MGDRTGRRPRTTAALAGLMLAAALLAGCSAASSGGGADSGSRADAPAGQPEAGEDAAVSTDDRSVVVEGTMSVRVENVTEAGDSAVSIAVDAGGRVDGRDEFSGVEDDESRVQLVLRIPADRLESALDALRALGDVESLQTTSTDVTTSVEDTDARIAALRATLARLAAFQAQAASIDDLLAIEEQISTRQVELEGLLARQADLAEQTSFSTMTVSLYSPSAPIVGATPDSFVGGVVVGWNAFVAVVSGFLIVLGVLLPWLVAAAVVAGIVVLLIRWLQRRRSRRQPVAAPPPAAGAAGTGPVRPSGGFP